MSHQKVLSAGGLLALLAVGLGAFGAHAIKGQVSPEMMAVFETGNRYHIYHALGLLVAGSGLKEYGNTLFRKGAWSFLLGILIFSGSLYTLALSEIRWLGALTPLGGICFLLGWLLLAIGFWGVTSK